MVEGKDGYQEGEMEPYIQSHVIRQKIDRSRMSTFVSQHTTGGFEILRHVRR